MTDRFLRRSLLITPGNRSERHAKAAASAADGVVLDLEDGVAPDEKSRARAAIREALATIDFGARERVVRLNAMTSTEVAADLAALDVARIDTVFLPKVESAEEVRRLDAWLSAREGGRKERVGIIATIETPRGLWKALEIADASSRLVGLFFGSGDYALATGSTVSAAALSVPRSLVVAAASAARIVAIDAAYFTAVRDVAATSEDAIIARNLGFQGKLVFHPDQIAPVNEVFSPTSGEIARARRIVTAFAEARAQGRGTALVDGTFIALDIALMAERVLERARRLGRT